MLATPRSLVSAGRDRARRSASSSGTASPASSSATRRCTSPRSESEPVWLEAFSTFEVSSRIGVDRDAIALDHVAPDDRHLHAADLPGEPIEILQAELLVQLHPRLDLLELPRQAQPIEHLDLADPRELGHQLLRDRDRELPELGLRRSIVEVPDADLDHVFGPKLLPSILGGADLVSRRRPWSARAPRPRRARASRSRGRRRGAPSDHEEIGAERRPRGRSPPSRPRDRARAPREAASDRRRSASRETRPRGVLRRLRGPRDPKQKFGVVGRRPAELEHRERRRPRRVPRIRGFTEDPVGGGALRIESAKALRDDEDVPLRELRRHEPELEISHRCVLPISEPDRQRSERRLRVGA